ncbi:hypothetical protein [Winogradskyella tangerina]|uniref:hypothetical protein n=1 Tax=Winogradskyella tangerina TaxID=2023240 RepID=UPI0013009862|nr:hypothetical protein [Winogradskyella tangerina]
MKKLLVFALLLSFAIPTMSSAQTEKFDSLYEKNKTIINSNIYQFNGDWVFEGRNREELVSSNNFMKIDGKAVEGTFHALSSERRVITYNDELSDYKVNFNDSKQEITIKFVLSGQNIIIDLKPNGKAFIKMDGPLGKITQVGKISKL